MLLQGGVMTQPYGYFIDQLGILLDAMDSGSSDKQLKLGLSKFARAIGFQRFAYLCTGGDSITTLTDLPVAWEDRYHAKRYVSVDPVVGLAKRSSKPFQWSLSAFSRGSVAVREFCDEIGEIGIAGGVTVPMQVGFGRTAMLSFINEEENVSEFYANAMHNVVAAVAYVHLHLSQTNLPIRSPDVFLTPRETGCVIWTSFGKKKAEIAQMYGLSEKTVRFHLDNAKSKLNASNVAHMVRRAFETGVISQGATLSGHSKPTQ